MNESHAATADGSGWYEVSIQGRLDQRWSAWFEAAMLTQGTCGTTILRARVDDQATLHGLIQKVADLGLELVSVTHDESRER